MGRSVPKCDSSTGFRFTMLGTDRPEQTVETACFDGRKAALRRAGADGQEAKWSRPPGAEPLPNSTFVAHLIATAEHVPQTRSLRRATPADALSAYRSHQAPKVHGRRHAGRGKSSDGSALRRLG